MNSNNGGAINFSDIIKKSMLKGDIITSLGIIEIMIGMVVTLTIGMLIFWIYKKTFRGVVYSFTFNVSLVMMTLITSLIIITISSNIVLSLGMVGALSIVRFRTAIKDPLDIIFMFWSIAAGIASGAGFYTISIIGSLFIAVTLVLLLRIKFIENVYLLVIHYDESAHENVKYHLNKLKYKLKSKTVTKKEIEMTVEIRMSGDNTYFMNEITILEGVRDAVILLHNGEYAS